MPGSHRGCQALADTVARILRQRVVVPCFPLHVEHLAREFLALYRRLL